MLKCLLMLLALLWLPVAAWAQPYLISAVQVEGVLRVEPSAVRAVISVQPGQTVTLDAIDKDIQAIFKLGRFTDVSADITEQGGATILTYRLVERPLLRKVVFSGNKEFTEEKLRTLISLKIPDIYNPRLVEQSTTAIRKAYVEEGYHAVVITPELVAGTNGEATLTLAIKEGEKVLIDTIRFEGNTVFSDRKLRKVMQTKERWFLSWLTDRGTYREDLLDNDLELLADQYFNQGYVQVKVRKPQITLVDENRYMDILIVIEEGPQFHVGKIEVAGDLIKPAAEILALTKLKAGDVFSRELLRQDITTINDLYADQGYAYVNVAPLSTTDPDQRTIDLKYDIEQGFQVHIDRIRVSGNTKTRDKVVRREMKLVEGDLYSATALKESRRRLNNLGFFEEVNLATAKGPEEALMDIDISVKEKPTGTFSLGFGYSSVDKFIGQGSITQANFLGRGLKLNLSGSIGGTSTTYQLGLLDPYFLDRNLSLGGDLYKTDREWTDFSKKATGGDIKLGFPLTDNSRAFFIYRYEQKDLYDVDPNASRTIKDQAGQSSLSSIYASVSRDSTDYRLDPSRGGVSEFSIEYAGLGGTDRFARTILDHRHFWPWFWGTVFSIHGQVGYVAQVGGREIPIDERFYLGGIRTLRGFKSREVGPRVRRVGNSVDPVTGAVLSTGEDFEYIGGTKDAYFNVEYLFPLVKDLGLKGVLFYDTGNAWSEDQDYFTDMRSSVGAGIRWFSPLGPLRLEWGKNLDPKEGEGASQFEFSIGNFF
ncbi:outer membrane protein assembly factor BamA [Desulfuromonas carbonis]|uniref:outer membrane protein assembly factor BamA n=1 Tax=Desulfuromonas sp. DDH964 TaxID=1823759 RepID=UPI00078D9B83|nr:outer membrane protein assembly factor BamA [Desulfuromonas sp. DDH964]AMV72679.1 outer membrane protein assembly complex protein YaeT [Desulfuromonas sp. DDH964]